MQNWRGGLSPSAASPEGRATCGWHPQAAAGLPGSAQRCEHGGFAANAFVPLREPAARAVMRGALRSFLLRMATVLGLTFTAARDVAQSVMDDLTDDAG